VDHREPNAPPDVAAVYRAVLDDIFPPGPNGPTIIAIDQMRAVFFGCRFSNSA
jgi:hypothetical protein